MEPIGARPASVFHSESAQAWGTSLSRIFYATFFPYSPLTEARAVAGRTQAVPFTVILPKAETSLPLWLTFGNFA